ncbi:hypothetical protein GWO60_08940 [Corynebacterium macginleyi]|uniref:Uncharacterized protein n=1 Tax=Corynebacterium macginleyi TaxID=38290 RepID=A0ABS1Y7U0_9CORY|nr:hypothetical protein [Corynebacterium macginleyi]MBK4149783.1 hypothetical protein [Corynebacterium macginleyi]MBK4151929.1 hypothetical protein [Corynebacterium macginleyi]MBK4162209.1 hypothetical protein [Corynebacterium macginleyi]MBK4168649.1 hypothetical protein [Corynebacterium macginleyi]MBK4174631.1 hypothetical protein [Corynebacterium macginleyi]
MPRNNLVCGQGDSGEAQRPGEEFLDEEGIAALLCLQDVVAVGDISRRREENCSRGNIRASLGCA